MRNKINQMNQQQQYQQKQNFDSQNINKEKSKPPKDDYIDFEEVK